MQCAGGPAAAARRAHGVVDVGVGHRRVPVLARLHRSRAINSFMISLAAEDAADARVGPGAGDRILPHVTIAAVHLHAGVDHPALHFGAPQLGHRRRGRVEAAVQVRREAPVDEAAADRGLGSRVGEREARVLEFEERLPNARRALTCSTVWSSAVSAAATAPSAMIRRSCGSSVIRYSKPRFLAEQVRARHPHAVEEQLRGVLRLEAPISRLRPRANPSRSVSTSTRLVPRAPFSGSVLATTTTRSAIWPLVMRSCGRRSPGGCRRRAPSCGIPAGRCRRRARSWRRRRWRRRKRAAAAIRASGPPSRSAGRRAPRCPNAPRSRARWRRRAPAPR